MFKRVSTRPSSISHVCSRTAWLFKNWHSEADVIQLWEFIVMWTQCSQVCESGERQLAFARYVSRSWSFHLISFLVSTYQCKLKVDVNIIQQSESSWSLLNLILDSRNSSRAWSRRSRIWQANKKVGDIAEVSFYEFFVVSDIQQVVISWVWEKK